MKALQHFFILVALFGWPLITMAQLAHDDALYQLLKSQDSLLFDAAFNRMDTEKMEALFTEDFEFYHDKGGATLGREAFLGPMEKQFEARDMSLPQPAKRILLEESLEVFPLYDQGALYGAIQQGMHRFEFLNSQQEYEKGDVARFTHVWILQGDSWRIKRELSFDHHPSEPQHQSSSN